MFHVPESRRQTSPPVLASTAADGNNGCFIVESPEPGWMLALICSDGAGWEHVSVHAFRDGGRRPQTRIPGWREMCFVKRLCWDAEDLVMQLHPKESEYVDRHPSVLHLWRPVGGGIPAPPRDLV